MMFPNLVTRFIRYAKLNTRSDATSKTIPTTTNQTQFAKLLLIELAEVGLSDVKLNPNNGFVTALLPATIDYFVPTIGFIAHLDTANFNSVDINPQIHSCYSGETIVLNRELDIKLDPNEFPNLKNYLGETLITTDGLTLLGADDKAGIAEIISSVEYLLKHPEIKHGAVKIAFGPDEEIGRGADLFDVVDFAAMFAYTVDSGAVGHFEYETFNAAEAIVSIKGTSVHPGTAKGLLVNTLKIAKLFDASLPRTEIPEQTEGYEGFYLLNEIKGTVESGTLTYIIRDHDMDKFQARKQLFIDNAKQMNKKYDEPRISVQLMDQYYNMGSIIKKMPKSIDLAIEAMENLEIEPLVEPFRGGTDGSKISFLGLPCPNLFTGGENFHGRYEFISIESMELATKTIVEIIRLNADKK